MERVKSVVEYIQSYICGHLLHLYSNTNLVFKCRINKLSLSKVYKGEKSLHSLPRVAIALAEAQAMVLFFNA